MMANALTPRRPPRATDRAVAAAWLVLGAFVGGCAQAEGDPEAETRSRPRQVLVCGIDRTGSYDFPSIGLRMCAERIHEMQPGDITVVRWIAEASYGHQQHVLRVELPGMDLPECANPWNRACQEERRAAEHHLEQIKGQSIRSLLETRPETAQRTDILGFFQAASDVLSSAPAGSERFIYVATDLVENVWLRVEPDLAGAHVHVVALQTGTSPMRSKQLLEWWEDRLRRWGAAEIRFEMLEVGS